MRLIVISFFFCLQSLVSIAQDNTAEKIQHSILKNAIYGEIGGHALVWSLNYERIFYDKGVFAFTGRSGIGFTNLYKQTNAWFLPFSASLLIGKRSSKFELTGGYTLAKGKFRYELGTRPQTYGYNYSEHFFYIPTFGYRFQKKHFQFRIFGSVLLNPQFIFLVVPSAGLSFGYCFGKNKH